MTECPEVYGRNGAFGAPMFNVRCSIGTAPLEVTIARVPASQKSRGLLRGLSILASIFRELDCTPGDDRSASKTGIPVVHTYM